MMRVDLDEHAGLEGLPRFQMAMQQVKRFGRLMYLTGGAGAFGLLLAFSIDLFSPGSLWMAVLGNVSAALLLLTAGLQSAKHVALWRARALGAFDAGVLSETPATLDESGWYERLLTRLSDSGESLIRHIGAS
ncbi:Band 7 protein, partial [Pseudomonas coronafaciens pv. oryzae]